MDVLRAWMGNRIVAGAVAGAVAAAVVDFRAFQSWKSAQEALTYDWGVAAWRWLQGAVSGAVAAAGVNGLS